MYRVHVVNCQIHNFGNVYDFDTLDKARDYMQNRSIQDHEMLVCIKHNQQQATMNSFEKTELIKVNGKIL